MYIPMPLRQSDTRPSPSLPFSLFLPCQSASACTAAKRRHITRIHNNLHRRRTSRTKIKLPGRKVNTDRHSYLMASCYLEISVALCARPRYLYKNALPFPVRILGHCFQFKVWNRKYFIKHPQDFPGQHTKNRRQRRAIKSFNNMFHLPNPLRDEPTSPLPRSAALPPMLHLLRTFKYTADWWLLANLNILKSLRNQGFAIHYITHNYTNKRIRINKHMQIHTCIHGYTGIYVMFILYC